MPILSKLIYLFNVIPIKKSQKDFCRKLNKMVLEFSWKHKHVRRVRQQKATIIKTNAYMCRNRQTDQCDKSRSKPKHMWELHNCPRGQFKSVS